MAAGRGEELCSIIGAFLKTQKHKNIKYRYQQARRCQIFLLLFGFMALTAITTDAFSSPSISGRQIPLARRTTGQFQLKAHAASSELFLLLSRNINVGNADQDRDVLKSTVSALQTSFLNSNISNIESRSRFDPLVGLYEVRTVITVNPNYNPVGGKWMRSNGLAQKLFRTRAAYQHLVPFNSTGQSSCLLPGEAVAEAINVVSLDALDGLLRITVILCGDAVPLSIEERFQMNANRTIAPLTNLAVRAVFDQPRIFLGSRWGENKYSYLPLNIGPVSSVVLDTTYCDRLVRIGRGGTSGTGFLFVSTNAEEESEYAALMSIPTAKRRSAIGKMGMIMAASLYITFGCAGAEKLGPYASILKSAIANSENTATSSRSLKRLRLLMFMALHIFGGITSAMSGILVMLLLFSSGGIERDGVSRS